MFEFQNNQIVKLTHDSGNEYFGKVIYRKDRADYQNKWFVETKFFGWNIDLTNIFDNKKCWFKNCELMGMSPEFDYLLELPPETLQLFQDIKDNKFSDKKWSEEYRTKRDVRTKK